MEQQHAEKKWAIITVITVAMVIGLGVYFLFYSTNSLEGFYISESKKYSLELKSNGVCTWYQDGTSFDGSYSVDESGLVLSFEGHGTSFVAVPERRKLKITCGNVD